MRTELVATEQDRRAEAAKTDKELLSYVEASRYTAGRRPFPKGWKLTWRGEDGIGCMDHASRGLRIIHSVGREDDGDVWAHVSMSRHDGKMPTWAQLRDAWWMIYPEVTAVVVIAPESKHVNIAEVAHAWGCLTSTVLPDFTGGTGSI